MLIEWNSLKSERLKKTRGVSFEEILSTELIALREHPARPHQKIMVFKHKGEFWAVPFVMEADKMFLKTIYPSRKFRNIYREGKGDA